MKPVDKLGNTIYEGTFRKLLVAGDALIRLGYRESGKKPNLFYRREVLNLGKMVQEVVFFADMRGTDEVKVWEDPVPMFYVGPEGLPTWVRNRASAPELKRLEDAGVEYRFSFEGTMFDEDTSVSRAQESELARSEFVDIHDIVDLYRDENGTCKHCGKDILKEGLFCSRSCVDAFIESSRERFMKEMHDALEAWPICEICGVRVHSADKADWVRRHESYGLPEMREALTHHVSYERNITMRICSKCRAKIRGHDPEYAKYRAIDERPTSERMYRLVPCRHCSGKARVLRDSEDTEGVCFSCKRRADAQKKKLESWTEPHDSGGAWGKRFV